MTQLGIPNQYRRQHTQFDQHGIDEVQERLRLAGSETAIVRSQQSNISQLANNVLTNHQLVALAVYCKGSVLSHGKHIIGAYDGIPMDSSSYNEPTTDEFDSMCIAAHRFIHTRLTAHTKLLATGVSRAIYHVEGTPKIHWQHIAEQFTKTKCMKEKTGSLKTFLSTTTLEMSRLLSMFWNSNPPSEYCKNKIHANISDFFAS
ncbi:MAG: hypothetical protein AAF228_11760 [Pseudomonadota bacterium]